MQKYVNIVDLKNIDAPRSDLACYRSCPYHRERALQVCGACQHCHGLERDLTKSVKLALRATPKSSFPRLNLKELHVFKTFFSATLQSRSKLCLTVRLNAKWSSQIASDLSAEARPRNPRTNLDLVRFLMISGEKSFAPSRNQPIKRSPKINKSVCL